jgi:aminopeptidase N
MRYKFLILALLCFNFCFAQQNFDDGVDLEANAKAEMYAKRMEYQATMGRGSAASENFDIKYYRCEWEVDPAVRYIKGKVTIYFKLFTGGNSITVDLSSALTVDSIKRANSTYAFTHTADAIQITFSSNTQPNVLDSVSIWYKGVPTTSGFGSFTKATTPAGADVLWTLSQPYGAKDWWPCNNGLNDKADSIDIFLTHPAALKGISNGMLQSVTNITGNKAVSHWKHRYPVIPYLIFFSVTDYAVLNHTIPLGNINLPMITYCYPASVPLFQTNTVLTDAPMQQMHALSPYPFINEKYGHTQFGWSGGMEHQTNSAMGSMSESLIVHELVHQWVGNKITCASWQDTWLNEGMASYFMYDYLERKYPQNLVFYRSAVVNSITSQPGGSVKVVDTTNANNIFSARLVYRKGGHLLFMLRFILGDAAFENVIRKYLNAPELAYASASTSDFKRILERETGRDLTYFFNQWFSGEGFPSFKVKWNVLDTHFVKINLTQTTSHPSVSFYKTPLELTFKNATQSKKVRLENNTNNETFIRRLDFKPDTVFVDSSFWIISRNNTTEKLPEVNDGSSDPKPTNNGQGGIDVNPNPVTGPLNVYLHDFASNNVKLRILNAAGQLVYAKDVALWYGTATVAIPNLAGGMYIIEASNSETQISKKVIKQ